MTFPPLSTAATPLVWLVLYFSVGVAIPVGMAFYQGRRGQPTLGGGESLPWFFFWPVLVIVLSMLYLLDKYGELLERVGKIGKETTLPPKNAHPDAKIVKIEPAQEHSDGI